MSHVGDEKGHWTIFSEFTHLLEEGAIPLLHLNIFGYHFTLTKFMILELVAAGLIIAIFVPLARRAAKSDVPTGPWWNLFESFLTFIRDEVAKPNLASQNGHNDEAHGEHAHAHAGHGHDAHAAHKANADDEVDRYVPFLWTLFLFILVCNLLGMVPLMGSPTASIYMTGALGLIAFVMMHGAAIAKMGFLNYVKSLWPPMEIPFGIGIILKPMIFAIELLGTVIKSGVLAVRLFANMFAGHMVLGMILYFIVLAANASLAMWAGVTVASILGVAALSLLELFVAFLQAYIFTFLTALFMGMALNPQH